MRNGVVVQILRDEQMVRLYKNTRKVSKAAERSKIGMGGYVQ